MKGNRSQRVTAQQISSKFHLLCKAALSAGIILLMLTTPPTVLAGKYDLKGSIEAAKKQEQELLEKRYARAQKLYDLMTDPNGKYRFSHEKAIKILKSRGFLVDRLMPSTN